MFVMQGSLTIIVSDIMTTEGVNKSSATGMKEIVTQLYTEIDKLRNSNMELDKENKMMERKLKINEEDIEYLVKLNKPLEKAYRSLQRKYQKATDELDMLKKGAQLRSEWANLIIFVKQYKFVIIINR